MLWGSWRSQRARTHRSGYCGDGGGRWIRSRHRRPHREDGRHHEFKLQNESQGDWSDEAKNGVEPAGFVVGLDALGVCVHKSNPLDEISIEELGEIYGEGGKIEKWLQVGIDHQTCETDEIIRVGRQNSSETYFYFREAVVGEAREFCLDSIHRPQ